MAVVWRVQFFDDSVGKNKMSGWMLEHLKAGEVLDGWNVEGGHCQARNFISVQVKCAVREADVAKCYDSDGNPYPPRPDGAFSGDHNPNGSGSGPSAASAQSGGNSASNKQQKPNPTLYWNCWSYYVLYPNGKAGGPEGHTLYANIFPSAKYTRFENQDYSTQFQNWVEQTHSVIIKSPMMAGCANFPSDEEAQTWLRKNIEQSRYQSRTPNSMYRLDEVVTWTPQ
jgi:hypothetical protein